MPTEVLALARANQRKASATNVEFLKGTIESIPPPDNSVDVIISNCVINLSSDNRRRADDLDDHTTSSRNRGRARS